MLVATSVVEVGVDVPNGVIIVEDADRHGVSTLHQLRGRGSWQRQSECFLLIGKELGSRRRMGWVLEKPTTDFTSQSLIFGCEARRPPRDEAERRRDGPLPRVRADGSVPTRGGAKGGGGDHRARYVRGENLPAPLAIALKDKDQLVDLNV